MSQDDDKGFCAQSRDSPRVPSWLLLLKSEVDGSCTKTPFLWPCNTLPHCPHLQSLPTLLWDAATSEAAGPTLGGYGNHGVLLSPGCTALASAPHCRGAHVPPNL